MKSFFQQFVPALAAGMLVLLATVVLQNRPASHDALAYGIYSTYIDPEELSGSTDTKKSGLYLSIVKIYNIGKEDAYNFDLAVSQIKNSKNFGPLSLKIDLRDTVLGKDITSQSVGEDGILKIPVDKIGIGGDITLRILGNAGVVDSVDVSKPGVSILPVSIAARYPPDAGQGATIIFLAGILAVISAFVVFMIPQIISAYKRS